MTQEQLDFLSTIETHELTSYIKDERGKAFIVWGADDVMHQAKDYGFEMDEDDAMGVIGDIERTADCEYGITWATIQNGVEEWIEDNSFDVVIKENSTGEERTAKFCSITTNENIEDFWNDDAYYFYGLSRKEVKSFIGKGEMVGDAIIVSV